MNNTDENWEQWGAQEPYYGVLSEDRFKKDNLNAEGKQLFFASGEAQVEFLLHLAETTYGPINYHSALDFGCGVGRLTIPLCKRFQQVVATDISESMLRAAKQNCTAHGVMNAIFAMSDDSLSQVTGTFDLIYTYIVLQHIPWQRGKKIIKQLLARLNPGGIAAIHINFYSPHAWPQKLKSVLRKKIPVLHHLCNVMEGKNKYTPMMQMNNYNLNHVAHLFHQAGITNLNVRMEAHGRFIGAVIIGRMPN